MPQSILAPNASPLMRALEAAMLAPDAVWDAALRVGDVKRDVLDATLPFLVYEYGLEPVANWVPDLRRLLVDGRRWQRVRGTPRAIELALGWIDVTPERIEEHASDRWWDLFQLGLQQPVTDQAALERIIALTRLSKPAHKDVIRVYNDVYDLRALKMNRGRTNGNVLINDWSGVWVKPGWPKISFGRKTIGRTDAEIAPASTAGLCVSELFHRLDRNPGFRVDRHRSNGGVLRTASVARSALQSEHIVVSPMQGAGAWPTAGWPDGSYASDVAVTVAAHQQFCGGVSLFDPPLAADSVITDGQDLAIDITEREPITPWSAGAWPDGPWGPAGYSSLAADAQELE
jgi:hypothetical protein